MEQVNTNGHAVNCGCEGCIRLDRSNVERQPMNYIVTKKSNPNAEPFILGSGGFWHVEANSPAEAIEKVASGFWEPMREQTKSELIAYLKRPLGQLVTCALCSKVLEYAEQFECSTCDRTVCRDCSNQHTIEAIVRCKACSN